MVTDIAAKVTHTVKTQNTTSALLATAPAEWQECVNRCLSGGPGIGYLPRPGHRASLDDVVRELDSRIQHMARLRAYLEARTGDGCGDQGHDAGVKNANALVTKIRRALGLREV